MALHLNTSTRSGEPDAFSDLLRALNPYLNDLLPQPQFYRFCDLPVELRFNVYEHYFRSEQGVLLTRNWPQISQITNFVSNPALDERSQILPNVCVVDRTTGKEAIACLLSVATLELYFSTEIDDLSKVASACHLNGVRLRDQLHNVSLTHINGCYRRLVRESSTSQVLTLTKNLNTKATALLQNSCFDNLHQLRLTLHAPIYEPTHNNDDDDDGPKTVRCSLPIDEYLENFDLSSITRLKRLQKVVFIAKTHQAVMKEEMESGPDVKHQGERMEHLHAVAGMARQVKATFQARSQKVVVQVCLKLSDRSREETVQ